MNNNPKILVVDDDPEIFKLLEVNLKNAGYELISAYDGEKALVQAKQNQPDLIILDIMLPGMDGYEVCQKLRTEKSTYLTPILVTSVKDKPVDKITSLKLGANDYITKPFDINELLARIESFLKHTEETLSINPLTRLPGNVSIMNELNRRLNNKERFTFVYLDINNFKSFNDKYGFYRGDEVIKFTAEVMRQCINENDFVGHVGGDDFVLVCEIKNTESICGKITGQFDEGISKYYDSEDIKKGYIISKDRQGNIKTFPIMTLSMGIVTNERQDINHYGKIVELATEMKNYIKTSKDTARSMFAVDKRISQEVYETRGKILIADDDTNILKLLRVNLEPMGYKITCVFNGEDALNEFTKSTYDMLIMDVVLPGRWGIDICKLIRGTVKSSNIPILLISGVYDKLKFKLDAERAGASGIITKPFEINDFVKYIEKLLLATKTEPTQAISPGINKKYFDIAKKYSADKKILVYYPDGKIVNGITSALNPGGSGFNMTIYGENKRVYIAYSSVLRVEVVDEF